MDDVPIVGGEDPMVVEGSSVACRGVDVIYPGLIRS